jgi:hypothetical protein
MHPESFPRLLRVWARVPQLAENLQRLRHLPRSQEEIQISHGTFHRRFEDPSPQCGSFEHQGLETGSIQGAENPVLFQIPQPRLTFQESKSLLDLVKSLLERGTFG